MSIYYHFTAKHLFPKILKEGLTLGMFPLVSQTNILFIKLCQWLTTNNNFNQSWNTTNSIKYSRNDYRLKIEIPRAGERKVIKATDYIKTIPVEYRHIVTDWNGSEDWYLFMGEISPEWIVGYDERECNEPDN